MTQTQNIYQEVTHVGQDLKVARERLSLSVGDLALVLKIQPAYITAIETLNKSSLPNMGYALGFVRAYAKHVGLHAENITERYKTDIDCPHNMGVSNRPHHVPKLKFRIPRGSVAAVAAIVFTFGLVSWYGMETGARSAAQAIAQNASMLSSDAPANARTPISAHEDAISLLAVQASWVQITDRAGTVLISRVMVPGDVFETTRGAMPLLSLRDAGAIELYLGGRRVGPIGQKGAMGTNIPLANVALPGAASLASSSASAR